MEKTALASGPKSKLFLMLAAIALLHPAMFFAFSVSYVSLTSALWVGLRLRFSNLSVFCLSCRVA